MAFPVKDWKDLPAGQLPQTGEALKQWFDRVAQWAAANPTEATFINATGLEDLESRLSAYTDSLSPESVNLWKSQSNPGAVTDWGAIVNTMLGLGFRHFVWGPHDFPITTFIDGRQITGIMFEGSGGWTWYEDGRTDGNGRETGHTRLIWKGGAGTGNATGTAALGGVAIDFSSATTGPNGNNGAVLRNLMVLWDNPTWDGTLVRYKNNTMGLIERCYFGRVEGGSGTAAKCAVSLAKCNTVDIAESNFDSSFLSPIRGRESGENFCNVVRFRDCTFQGGINAGITNPGIDWLIDHCIFEFPGLGSGKPFITTDFTYGAGDQIDLIMTDCAYWDASLGNQYMVKAPEGNQWSFTARNCADHNNVGGYAKLYEFLCTGSVSLIGGGTRNVVDVGDGSIANQRKSSIWIEHFDINSTTSKSDRLLNVHTGHHKIHVDAGVHTGNDLGAQGQVKPVAAQRALTGIETPTIALAGTAPAGFSVDMIPSPMGKFWILIRNASGGAAGAGLIIANITMPFDIPSMNKALGSPAAQQFLIPNIGPMKLHNNANFTPTAGAYWQCQPEAHCDAVDIDSAAMTKFYIYFNANLNNLATVGIAVDLTHH